MHINVKYLFFGLLALMASCTESGDESLKYLGQERPTLSPEVFAPGLISLKSISEFGSVFNKEGTEFFYGVDLNGRTEIRYSKLIGEKWSEPKTILSHELYGYNDPFLSPDEKRLYFISKRALDGLSAKEDHDIWYVQKQKNGWSEPINAGPNINSPGNEYYISFTQSGTMYFSSNKEASEDNQNNFDIYTSKSVGGTFQEADKLGVAVNTPNYEADVFVDPAEHYIIFCARHPELVNSWKALIDIPNIRVSVKSLETVSKWLDDGIELTFEAIQDGAKIVNKNGDEVGKLIKSGSDEFLEIADDFFVEVGTAKSFGSVTVKGNTGESFIDPGYVAKADGTIGFVENVTSYGNNTIQTAIKQRYKLRGDMPGISKTQDAHHVLPVQLLKENDYVKKAVEGGFEFNKKLANGEPIEKFVKATGQGRHGPHPQYTAQINEVFIKLGNQGVQLNPTQAKKLMENLVGGNSNYQGIRNIINTTSDKINALDLKLSNINVLDLLGN